LTTVPNRLGFRYMEKARPIKSETPSQIAIEIIEEGRETRREVIQETIPEGFPHEQAHHLAGYMSRGFNLALARQGVEIRGLEELAEPLRGRPIDTNVEEEAQKAAKLRKQDPKMSWQRIARVACRNKGPRHTCNKKCADRLEKAAKQYETRQEVESLRNPD
jgi:hypothetical protein